MYRRTKNQEESRSVKNSESGSRVPPATQDWNKSKKVDLSLDEKNWMGSPIV